MDARTRCDSDANQELIRAWAIRHGEGHCIIVGADVELVFVASGMSIAVPALATLLTEEIQALLRPLVVAADLRTQW
jgi:hypothetical protein